MISNKYKVKVFYYFIIRREQSLHFVNKQIYSMKLANKHKH